MNRNPQNLLEFQDWGLINYEEALNRQLEILESVRKYPRPGVVVFCSHHPIVTLGSKTQKEDVFQWSGPIKEISRGGRATYHGPSQLVIYPICHLSYLFKSQSINYKPNDIGDFLKFLEDIMIQLLHLFEINASPGKENAGVWVKNQKIASIGIGVKHWVTYHGISLNLENDPEAFQGMKPCGLDPTQMTSMEKILNIKPSRTSIQDQLISIFTTKHLITNTPSNKFS